MFLKIDIWLLPAIAAGASSYLVCLLWERLKNASAPNGILAGFLVSLSFFMGAVSAYFRQAMYAVSLENNIIVMFTVGASTTFFWLLLRKHIPSFNGKNNRP
jgi:glucan phosphoethanolaminetransferase (alkaline phosphatase superfamily)